MRSAIRRALFVLAVAGSPLSAAATAQYPGYSEVTIVSGLSAPTTMALANWDALPFP